MAASKGLLSRFATSITTGRANMASAMGIANRGAKISATAITPALTMAAVTNSRFTRIVYTIGFL